MRWMLGLPPGAGPSRGVGIKIADIDTDIDETQPFLDPTGFSYPPGLPKCDAADSTSHTPDQDCKYVSPKVIVAKVVYNKGPPAEPRRTGDPGSRDAYRWDRGGNL